MACNCKNCTCKKEEKKLSWLRKALTKKEKNAIIKEQEKKDKKDLKRGL